MAVIKKKTAFLQASRDVKSQGKLTIFNRIYVDTTKNSELALGFWAS
jgi:transcription termination factor Rho